MWKLMNPCLQRWGELDGVNRLMSMRPATHFKN
jgi:hypothetical protein